MDNCLSILVFLSSRIECHILPRLDTSYTFKFFSHLFTSCFQRVVLNSSYRIWLAGLDVVRTDRALVYYENEANQAKLWDILSVYAWVDGEVGYMQGKFVCLFSFFCWKKF